MARRSDRHKFQDVLQVLNQNEISEMMKKVKREQEEEEAEVLRRTLKKMKRQTAFDVGEKRDARRVVDQEKDAEVPAEFQKAAIAKKWTAPLRRQKKQQKEMKKQDLEETQLGTSGDVLQILHNIEMAKARREQADTVTMLEKIHSRVKAALVHFGINPDLHMSQTQIMAEATLKNRPPGYSTKERRERILHQRSVIDHIHEYLQVSIRRNALMDEVGFWMNETTEAVAREMTDDTELINQEKEEKEIHRAIRNAMLTAESSAKKIKRLSETVFKEILEEQEEEEEESADMMGEGQRRYLSLLAAKKRSDRAAKPRQGTGGQDDLDDTSLMGDAESWKTASQEVKQALTECAKSARNANVKTSAKQALKQFNFICTAIERRNKEAAQFGQEMLDYQLKINQVSKANERLQNERDRLKLNIDDITIRMDKRKQQVEELEQKNKEMQEYIEALEEGGIWKRPSTVTIPMTPDIPEVDESADELVRLQNENEAMKHMVQQLRNENKQIKDKLSKLSVQISKLQNGLMLAKENAKQLEKQLELAKAEKSNQQSEWQTVKEDYHKIEIELKQTIAQLERDIALLKTELKGKNEAIQFQEKRLKEVTHETQTMAKKKRRASIMAKGKLNKMNAEELSEDPNYKQAVNRMKSDYEAEINKLKEHLLKERQRCEAALRRQDQELNNRLLGIHKECIHLLRAINRFKESMALIFDREGLLDLAHEMRTTLKDLPTEELSLPQDTKVMLSTVSGLATELMVALEFKVSQAMINKRIELKETQLMKKTSGEEHGADGEPYQEKLARLKQQNEQLQEKVNKAKDDVMATENLLTETKRIHEEKYQSLLERYKNLIINHNAAQKEIATIRKEFIEEIKKRDSKLHELRQTMTQEGYSHDQAMKKMKLDLRHAKSRLVQSRINLAEKAEPEVIKFSLTDQKRNLDKLAEALQEEKISDDMHFITMEVIKKSMDIPIIRLRNLFERYIQYSKFRENRDKLRKQLNQTTGAEHWELRQFIENMEKRMTETNQRWKERAEKVKQERTKLYEQMKAIFEAVYEESGILLIKPIFVYAPKKPGGELVPVAASGGQSVAMQVYSKGVRTELESPDALIGRHMNLIGDRGPMWKMPAISEDDDNALVTTPRLLDMDVNRDRTKAKQSLTPSGRRDTPCGRRSGMGDRGPLNLPPLATFMVTQSPFSPDLLEEDEDDDYLF